MARLLWLLLLVLAVFALLRGVRRRSAAQARVREPSAPTGAAPARSPQVMVRCAHCDMHLAEADALCEGDRSYCSVAHRDAGPAPTARS